MGNTNGPVETNDAVVERELAALLYLLYHDEMRSRRKQFILQEDGLDDETIRRVYSRLEQLGREQESRYHALKREG